jgi:hypothetical protein
MAVLQKGLRIRPQGMQTTGSMFGDAIYFANKAQKIIRIYKPQRFLLGIGF